MQVTWKGAVMVALAVTAIDGCSPSSPTVAVTYERFQFTCCANSEALTHAWHPGQVIALEWSAETAG